MEYKAGDKGPAGGIIFYDKGDNSDGWRYLEAAPEETEFEDKPWGDYDGESVGLTGTEIGSGKSNTEIIVSAIGQKERWDDREDYAARVCKTLKYGGYSDWFLPSKDELEVMIYVLDKSGNINTLEGCWSSSEAGPFEAWRIVPFTKNIFTANKHFEGSVRAARRF
jgi:hypothetical protein